MTDHGSPLPHMGWNAAICQSGRTRLFRGIEDGAYFYFVHSYAMPARTLTPSLQCIYGEALHRGGTER